MDKALGYLGLAARAGKIAVGAEDCAAQIKAGKRGFIITAADAGFNTLERVGALAHARGRSILSTGYTKTELAHSIGRAAPVALVMICDEGLAAAFLAAAKTDRGEQEEQV